MKATAALFGLFTLATFGAPEDYINFVRQTQEDSGVEWDVSVASHSDMMSPEGVGEAGSIFELWSVHSSTASEYFLDEEFVSSFTPEVSIEIHTLDPYDVIPRARVDQPFSVSINVGGLLDGPGVPEAAKKVFFTHDAFAYPEGLHGFPGGDPPAGN